MRLFGAKRPDKLKDRHYVGKANIGEGTSIKYPFADDAVTGKKVLIIDESHTLGKALCTQRGTCCRKTLPKSELRLSRCSIPQSAHRINIGEKLIEWDGQYILETSLRI